MRGVEVKSPYAWPTSLAWSYSVAQEDVSFSTVSAPTWNLPNTNSDRVSTSEQEDTYEACPESIQPFRISQEPVEWPWCNLAASKKRPCCASVNSRAPVGLVSRQWNAVNWAWILCDRRIHNDRASRSANLHQYTCPIYSSRLGFFWQNIASHRSVSTLTAQIWLPATCFFFKATIAVESAEICECDGHKVYKLSQRRLTADWLAPRECDCSRMRSKFSSDWMPSYIKATRPVLEVFKMAGYFPDRPRTLY